MAVQQSSTKVIFDMETFNLESLFCLALLISFKEIELKAVTLYPGTLEQVGVIRDLLEKLNIKNCLIGGITQTNKERINNLAEKLSLLHGYDLSMVDKSYYNYVSAKKDYADNTQQNIINEVIKKNKKVHILSGAPLLNISNAIIANKEFKVDRLFIQGGYIGNNFENNELNPAFQRKKSCYSYNVNEDYKAFEFIKNNSRMFNSIVMIGRNITHKFNYDLKFHREFFKLKHLNKANEFIYNGMASFLFSEKKSMEWRNSLMAMIARGTIKLPSFNFNEKHPYTPIPIKVHKVRGLVHEEIFSEIDFHSNIFGIVNTNIDRIIKINTNENLHKNLYSLGNKGIKSTSDDLEVS